MGIEVPVIDISGWRDERRLPDITAALDRACSTVGFLQIVGHGVSELVRQGLLDAAEEFFELPVASKLAYRPGAAHINRGYAPVGSESLSYSLGKVGAPDLFEAFNVGVDDRPIGDPYYERERDGAFAPNLWPSEVPTFRPRISDYFSEMDRLAHELTSIMATALGLPGDYFEASTRRSVNVLRLIRYERQPDEPEPDPGQMRMGAHTDYGILTILLADSVPGLQILGPDQRWHDVLPLEGAFIVNLGDALAVWTNDRWRSTLHRVVPPPAGEGPSRRRSAAFFHDGDLDARIECLPTCTDPEHPPRYPAITVKEHLTAKLLGPRLHAKSEAIQTVRDEGRAAR